MGWGRRFEHKGLSFYVQSDNPFAGIAGPQGCLFLKDPQTIQAIREKDTRIFEALNYLLDNLDDIAEAGWAADYHWWEEYSKDPGWKERLEALVQNPFAYDSLKTCAKEHLKAIEREAKHKASCKAVRAEFANKRDDFAIALRSRDGDSCSRCGKTAKQTTMTIDHIHPVALGGTNSLDNLQFLCLSCNSRKGMKVEIASQ